MSIRKWSHENDSLVSENGAMSIRKWSQENDSLVSENGAMKTIV